MRRAQPGPTGRARPRRARTPSRAGVSPPRHPWLCGPGRSPSQGGAPQHPGLGLLRVTVMTPPSRPPKRSPDTAECTLGRGAESPRAEDRPRRMPQTPSGSFSDDSVTIARLDGFCFSCFEQSGNQRPSGAPRKTAQLRWCLIGTLIFPFVPPPLWVRECSLGG